jgi:hypothetical protein
VGFVIFTHPDGRPVAINPEAVTSVHASGPGHHLGTMIDSTGTGSEIVKEPFEEVVRKLSGSVCK